MNTEPLTLGLFAAGVIVATMLVGFFVGWLRGRPAPRKVPPGPENQIVLAFERDDGRALWLSGEAATGQRIELRARNTTHEPMRLSELLVRNARGKWWALDFSINGKSQVTPQCPVQHIDRERFGFVLNPGDVLTCTVERRS